jgi:hypothetical protein
LEKEENEMKAKIFSVCLFSALLIFGVILSLRSHTEEEPYKVDLFAGQHEDVGDVSVWEDGHYLYIKYETTGGWCLTETHLQVATSLNDIPQAEGNPIPGHFSNQTEHNCVTEYTYAFDLEWVPDTILYIAAHAVVKKAIKEAPYYASAVFSSKQGLRKDGKPVLPERSVPEYGLNLDSTFFSLGFGGEIIVEFDCPISNGEGNDVVIWEETWGQYPLETAEVLASMKGKNDWTYLGTANNLTDLGTKNQHPSEFDLGDLKSAKYIKIIDTTNPDIHGADADGFDLNAVASLQDCIQEETAWGAGYDFLGENWATYFIYEVQTSIEVFPEEGTAYIGYEDWINGDFDYNDFGMRFSVEELYKRIESTDYLCKVTMTFTAVIYDSGMDHLIHIRRPFVGDYSYTVSRTTPAYPYELTLWDGKIGKETPAGTYTGSNELDVVLFNTHKYNWPQKQINETITVDVVLNDPSLNPKEVLTPPREYIVDSTTFYDLDPIMANYDPWEEGTMYQCRFYIPYTQVISNTGSQHYTPEIIPIGTKVPLILVVPYTDWIPPFEDTTITGPYRSFDDFYIYSTPLNWYDKIMVINNFIGQWGLSWGPYPPMP